MMASKFAQQQLQEKVEVLDGSRQSGSIRKAAVRIEDLSGLLDLPPTLKSTKVTAAPTMDEHNALVDDVQSLFNRLRALADALQGKLNT